MAKKRRREEEPTFEPPEFDEVHYMHREVEAAKASVTALLLAVGVALISFLFTQAGLGALGILLIVLVPFTLKWIYSILGIKLELFDRRVWAAMIFILITASISLWIVFLNPPFVDHTPPTIKEVQVYVGGQLQKFNGQSVTLRNATQATLIAYIPDNDPVTATFTIDFHNSSAVQRVTRQCSPTTSQCFIVIPRPQGSNQVTVRISAVDSNGNATSQDTVITLTFT